MEPRFEIVQEPYADSAELAACDMLAGNHCCVTYVSINLDARSLDERPWTELLGSCAAARDPTRESELAYALANSRHKCRIKLPA